MAEFVRAARLADVPVGTALGVVVAEVPVALYNVEGEIYATHDICSHALAHLSQGKLDGATIECPLHGAKFDVRTGRNLRFPAVVPVKRYEVKLEGDEVWVAVD